MHWDSTALHSNKFYSLSAFFLLLNLAQPAHSLALAEPLYKVSATKYLLGTKVDFIATHASVLECKKAFYAAFQEIVRVGDLLNSRKENSEIARINHNAGRASVHVTYETYAIIQRALRYAESFDGYFDISIGPVVAAWGFDGDREVAIPDEEMLGKLIGLVDFKSIVLSEQDTTVFLTQPGMLLDLGGIAKGYAIDRAAAVLQEHGVAHFLINAGGDIYASGYKFGEKKWRVGLQHPRQPNELLATFEVSGMAVATSGDYERFKMIDGARYHHIINPKTGFPARLNQSVTVFARSAEEADVWATYLFIVGREQFRAENAYVTIEAMFVNAAGEVDCERDLADAYGFAFQLKDGY